MKRFPLPPGSPVRIPTFGPSGKRGGGLPDLKRLPIEELPRQALAPIAFAMTGRLANLFPRWINENIGDDWGISGPGLLLVGLMGRGGELTMSDAAEALDLTPGAVTRIVKSLEDGGYVARVPNPEDRRQSYIRLTPEAQRKAKRLFPLHDELINKATASLNEDDLRAYLRVIIKLSDSLRDNSGAINE